MLQFSDAEEVLTHLRSDRFKARCREKGIEYDDLTITAVTIRESVVDRAIELAKRGVESDRCLMTVSTEEEHHFANSGPPCPTTGKSAKGPFKNAATPG